MALKANEYPDIWQFSEATPSPPSDYPKKKRVNALVDVFLQPQFFGKIVIWEHKNWFVNKKTIGKIKNGFLVMDYLPEAELVRYPIVSCSEAGHLSVLFAPLKSDLFLSKILEYGHYGKPCMIEMGTGKLDDPFRLKHGYDFSFVESEVFRSYEKIFTFSHDAEFLYEIFH